MKRMVKNGNLIDVEPDGTITVAGKPIGGGGGGSDYTAGRNITISDTKEISVNSELTGIEKIKLAPSGDYEISRDNDGLLISKNVTSGSDLAEIKLKAANNNTFMRLTFTYDKSQYQNIWFNTTGFNGEEGRAFLTRSSTVPLVPREEGTYLLKATVNNYGVASYRWEKQQ